MIDFELSLKRADNEVGSLLIEGYILTSQSRNFLTKTFFAVLQHQTNGNIIRITASVNGLTMTKNHKLVKSETF